METYPSAAFPEPKVNHAAEWTSPVRVNDPARGPAFVERVTDDQTYVYDVSWTMTQSQWSLFQNWIFHKVNNGADWFEMPVPLYSDLRGERQNAQVNFMGNQPKARRNGLLINITARLFIRNLTDYRYTAEFTQELLDLAEAGYDNLPVLLDRLEIFTNEDMQVIPA